MNGGFSIEFYLIYLGLSFIMKLKYTYICPCVSTYAGWLRTFGFGKSLTPK